MSGIGTNIICLKRYEKIYIEEDFDIVFWNNPTLFARIVINDYTHDIRINVVNNLNNPYPAFYKCENKGYINYLERVCKVIDRRMSRMGFKIKRKKKDNIFEYYENPKQIFK